MGVRIELIEIEEVMSSIRGIKDAAVLCVEQKIVAIYSSLSDTGMAEAELSSQLRNKLPRHSIPSKLVHRESMSLTANGKVDEKVLIAELTDSAVINSGANPKKITN